ncbi:H-NS histone family protein [Loktanella sp. S4079]|uniref:H-NS histone family protein n=1 Tax=Loktanella sp. S4079 TaxID=579483 RepID=UPI0005FA5FFA|nr:H-NS histone family protein [Loktanella sp. S4079]KJZ20830.1 DNA-binding protein [Loktanella sp. S4079]
MNLDLTSMSRIELETLKTEVEAALVEVAEKEKQAARDAAEKAVAAFGYSLADITGSGGRGRNGRGKSLSSPKYRNPADPEQTWTGKGRQPQWFKEAIAAGQSPDAMEI